MISIYCLHHDFHNYANNVQNILFNNHILSEAKDLQNQSLNNALRNDTNLYKIIIGAYDVQNNNICIRNSSNEVFNLNINQLVDFINNNA